MFCLGKISEILTQFNTSKMMNILITKLIKKFFLLAKILVFIFNLVLQLATD